jgi:protein-S-isoprenylcysteine O-methyltransferase Ste14
MNTNTGHGRPCFLTTSDAGCPHAPSRQWYATTARAPESRGRATAAPIEVRWDVATVRRSFIPIVLSAVLGIAIVGLGGVRLWTATGAQLVMWAAAIAAYLVWLVVESRLVSVRETTLPDAPADKGSLELYAGAQGAVVVLALAVPGHGLGTAVGATGLALLLVGVGFRLWAILALGHYYSRRVRLLDEHRVVAAGPYRLVRHPAYLGTLIGHLGFAIAFGSWIAVAAWAVLFVPMVVRRILVEESVLFELEGYEAYARQHRRLLPLLW